MELGQGNQVLVGGIDTTFYRPFSGAWHRELDLIVGDALARQLAYAALPIVVREAGVM